MNTQDILEAIDQEFSRLEQIKVLLTGTGSMPTPKRGRPAKKTVIPNAKKRTVSAEGRKRMAEAQRKRWLEARGERGAKG